MTTAADTLVKDRAYFASDLAKKTFGGHSIEHRADGSALVKDIEVFKAGTFRDSMGDQNTWTTAHLMQMVSNFDLLRSEGVFVDVPVRRDHSFSIDKVMGYFEALRVEGDRLLADIVVTEPTNVEKLARGTYRSRSLEVGMYVTNDETPYWPVVWGVAYVDIPAVEGLHNRPANDIAFFSNSTPTEENKPMTTENDKGAPRPATFTIKGVETSDYAAVQAYIGTLELRPEAAAAFRVKGAEVSDFAAVQAHIDTLEGFESETRTAGRTAFVNGLAADGKVAAVQTAPLVELVESMSDEQFTKFKAGYEAAPKLSLLGEHGANSNHTGNNPAGAKPAGEVEVLEGQVQMHRDAGVLTEDQIKETSSYRTLMQLRNES